MELVNHLYKFLYAYCTDFTINLANLTGTSYYEVNFFLFVVLYPLLLLSSVLLFLNKKRVLNDLKRLQKP